MTGPEIPEGLVKLHGIGEAYAELSMVEDPLPRMQLSPIVQPVVNLPIKPPPAKTRYVPGSLGANVAAVALNFSSVCVFNREDLSRVILEIYAVSVLNNTAGALTYRFRRDDQPVQTGHTFTALVPSYSDAGGATIPAVGMNVASNNIVAPGVLMHSFIVPANTLVTLPFQGVVNNGQFCVTSGVVNQAVQATWWFRLFPIILEQHPG